MVNDSLSNFVFLYLYIIPYLPKNNVKISGGQKWRVFLLRKKRDAFDRPFDFFVSLVWLQN